MLEDLIKTIKKVLLLLKKKKQSYNFLEIQKVRAVLLSIFLRADQRVFTKSRAGLIVLAPTNMEVKT